MIKQILPHIYHICVPLVDSPLRELNSYLIKDDGRCLLIDTGFRHEACRSTLQAALDELGVRREETDVLLTHRHYDHSGMADLFAGKDRRIYAGEGEIHSLNGSRTDAIVLALKERFRREGFPEKGIVECTAENPGITQGMPPGVPITPLRDGDALEIAGYRLKALLTPGHMCFWLEEQGAMFLGDHVLFDITPNITCWPEQANALGDYLDNLKAVRAYEVELPLPGHRAPGDFKNRIDRLLTHHQHRLEEARRLIAERPGQTAYEVAGNMRWKIRSDSWETFPPTQRWFAVGECLSHLDYLRLAGEIAATEENGILRYTAL